MLLQTAIPHYRQEVLTELCSALGDALLVLTGRQHVESSVQTEVEVGDHLRLIKNHFFLGGRLEWQSGMWRSVLRAEVVIIEGNPRILSSWFILAIRKLLRRGTVVWMHAWPRSGKNSRSDWIRHLMRLLADKIVVYTEQQARELRGKMPGRRIIAAPNALMRKASMGASTSVVPTNFIYVGRLVAAKKPLLAAEAFKLVLPSLPRDCCLLIIGAGPAEKQLQDFIVRNELQERILMPGHVSDENLLRCHYATAIASLSPGYVGLSITQSFAFGVPMIISRDEPHSPEIEAAQEGFNCRYFETDCIQSLADTLRQFIAERAVWQKRRQAIAESCAAHYSVEVMAERLVEAFCG